jgi:hypothetical protein
MTATRPQGDDDRIAKGDLRLVEVFEDDSVAYVKSGSTVGKQVDLVKWVAGRQEDDYREFYFDGELLKGRYVLMQVPEKVVEKAAKATWTTAYVNDLPDSHFFWVAPGGKKDGGKTTPRSNRYFPYKDADGSVDLPHLRNAIARIPQAKHEKLTDKKKEQLQAKARKLLEKETKGETTPAKSHHDMRRKKPKTPRVLYHKAAWVLIKFVEDDGQYGDPLTKRASADTDYVFLAKNAEKRIVLGPALVPEKTDLQGDIIGIDEIEKAAHNYLAEYNVSSQTGVMHEDFDRQVQVVESYIAPVDFVLEGRKIAKGTWMLAFKILDDETWTAVQKGELRGFSIGGVANESQKIDGTS